jgi:hypothetical protein
MGTTNSFTYVCLMKENLPSLHFRIKSTTNLMKGHSVPNLQSCTPAFEKSSRAGNTEVLCISISEDTNSLRCLELQTVGGSAESSRGNWLALISLLCQNGSKRLCTVSCTSRIVCDHYSGYFQTKPTAFH